jgi:hypothetical protein
LLCVLVLLSLCGYWFCFATVDVHESSDASEILGSQEIYPVEVEAGIRIGSGPAGYGCRNQTPATRA